MQPNNLDPKLQNVLNQLSKFGFKFYGFDENRVPLVISPNSQVVQINLAIDFVNKQIEAQRSAQSSGSLESGPTFNQNLDSKSVESSIETTLEKPMEKSMEQQKPQIQAAQPAVMDVPKKAPQIQLKRTLNKGYGDGFDPKSFNPEDLNSTLKFIESNSQKSKTSSNAWLSKLFKKFLAEYESGMHKE